MKTTDFGYLEKVAGDIHVLTKDLLGRMSLDDKKSKMAVRFIARGDSCLGSIYLLCGVGRVSDARILLRSLVDLLVHMKDTMDKDNVEDFWYHSLREKARLANEALDNPVARANLHPDVEKEAKRVVNEYNRLCKERGKPSWQKPNAKNVLKECGLEEVYKYGYGFPSSGYVHPVWGTGEIDHLILEGGYDSCRSSCEMMTNGISIMLPLMAMGIAFYNSGRSHQIPDLVGKYLVTISQSLQAGTYSYFAGSEEVFRLLR